MKDKHKSVEITTRPVSGRVYLKYQKGFYILDVELEYEIDKQERDKFGEPEEEYFYLSN